MKTKTAILIYLLTFLFQLKAQTPKQVITDDDIIKYIKTIGPITLELNVIEEKQEFDNNFVENGVVEMQKLGYYPEVRVILENHASNNR